MKIVRATNFSASLSLQDCCVGEEETEISKRLSLQINEACSKAKRGLHCSRTHLVVWEGFLQCGIHS